MNRKLWRVREIPEGDVGVLVSLRRLLAFILEPEHTQLVPSFLALEAWSTAPPGSWYHAQSIYDAVAGAILFAEDPPGEMIQSPDVLITESRELGHALGDCDDYVSLLAACYHAAGVPVRLRVVSQREDQEADHIYVEVNAPFTRRLLTSPSPDEWLTADPTAPDPVTGQMPAPFGVGLDRSGFTAEWPAVMIP